MGRGPEQTLSQRRHKNGQQIQKKLLNITSIQKDLIQSYGEIQKTVWQFLRKLKTELPYDPAVPLLITYSDKTVTQNDTPVFTVGFPGGATGKEPALYCRRCKRCMSIPGSRGSTEEGMATHSSILAWRKPWTEEPDWL